MRIKVSPNFYWKLKNPKVAKESGIFTYGLIFVSSLHSQNQKKVSWKCRDCGAVMQLGSSYNHIKKNCNHLLNRICSMVKIMDREASVKIQERLYNQLCLELLRRTSKIPLGNVTKEYREKLKMTNQFLN